MEYDLFLITRRIERERDLRFVIIRDLFIKKELLDKEEEIFEELWKGLMRHVLPEVHNITPEEANGRFKIRLRAETLAFTRYVNDYLDKWEMYDKLFPYPEQRGIFK